jgi:DNA-binding LacI/PurR family transcriptional regulator
MADVARLAGVSHQTVSRVINAHASVSPDTRRRVEAAIDLLGYRRNVAARALVTKESRTLGVVSVDTSHYGPSRTLFGVEAAARQAGYFVSFATLRHVDQTEMRAAVHHLLGANVDGIIVIAALSSALDAVAGVVSSVPLVSVASDELWTAETVCVDQEGGARRATRHLLDLGHETVFHVRGPDGWLDADARERGWRKELAAARAVAPTLLAGDWSPGSGLAAGRELASIPEATAVFVANDQMALGVVRALHEAGRRVPQDVSVVGFDDIPEAGFFLPPLTTVRQNFAELGRVCIDRLLGLIRDETPAVAEAVDTTLVVRESTAPARP